MLQARDADLTVEEVGTREQHDAAAVGQADAAVHNALEVFDALVKVFVGRQSGRRQNRGEITRGRGANNTVAAAGLEVEGNGGVEGTTVAVDYGGVTDLERYERLEWRDGDHATRVEEGHEGDRRNRREIDRHPGAVRTPKTMRMLKAGASNWVILVRNSRKRSEGDPLGQVIEDEGPVLRNFCLSLRRQGVQRIPRHVAPPPGASTFFSQSLSAVQTSWIAHSPVVAGLHTDVQSGNVDRIDQWPGAIGQWKRGALGLAEEVVEKAGDVVRMAVRDHGAELR